MLLPDLDGLTVCEILRRLPSTRRTPIILVTAVDADGAVSNAKGAT